MTERDRRGSHREKKQDWLTRRIKESVAVTQAKQPTQEAFNQHLRIGARCVEENVHSVARNSYEFILSLSERVLLNENNILLINKPPFMLTQGEGTSLGLEELVRCATQEDFFIAHRLDFNTSGIIVLARGMPALKEMTFQFANKEKSGIKKEYLALLDGEFAQVGRQPVAVDIYKDKNLKMHVVNKTSHPEWNTKIEDTLTYFTPKTLYETYGSTPQRRTLTAVELETGRKHQIRAIANDHLRMPVTGDKLYNFDKSGASRQLLHSYRFSFIHPVTGKHLTATAPIPEDFQDVLDGMRVVRQYEHGINKE